VQAQKDFEAKFSSKGVDPGVPVQEVSVPPRGTDGTELSGVKLGKRLDEWLAALQLAKSKSDAQRQIKAGAASLAVGDLSNPTWEKIADPVAEFDPWRYRGEQDKIEVVFKVGRKQSRVRFKFPPA
jgi:hypothetical protein